MSDFEHDITLTEDETERLRKVWEWLPGHARPGNTRLLLGRDPGFDPLRRAIAAQIGKRS